MVIERLYSSARSSWLLDKVYSNATDCAERSNGLDSVAQMAKPETPGGEVHETASAGPLKQLLAPKYGCGPLGHPKKNKGLLASA
jgi:hypothetical protein